MMIKSISPKDAFEALSTGEAILVDVREPDEFKAEHIAYGLSIPLSIFENEFATLRIPEDKKVFFHCLKGKRGEQACSVASNLRGFENDIFNIEGGITSWKEQGLPTVTSGPAAGGISIFRQVQMIVGGLVTLLIILGLLGLGFAFMLAGMLSFALFFAGVTGWCGLAMLLSRMPWNKGKV